MRTGPRHGPDAVRSALACYATWSSDARFGLSGLRAADIGDIDVAVTDTWWEPSRDDGAECLMGLAKWREAGSS